MMVLMSRIIGQVKAGFKMMLDMSMVFTQGNEIFNECEMTECLDYNSQKVVQSSIILNELVFLPGPNYKTLRIPGFKEKGKKASVIFIQQFCIHCFFLNKDEICHKNNDNFSLCHDTGFEVFLVKEFVKVYSTNHQWT